MTTKRIHPLLVGLIVAGGFFLLAGFTPTAARAKEIPFTNVNNGQVFHLEAEDTLKVSLRENPSTGADWSVTGLPPTLKLLTNEYIPDRPLIGSPGTRIFTFGLAPDVSKPHGVRELLEITYYWRGKATANQMHYFQET